MDDVFAAPREPGGPDRDDGIRTRVRNELYIAGFSAVGLGVLQVFCNPCFTMTVFAALAAAAAIRRPDRLAFAVGDNYPEDAGSLCRVLGWVTVALIVLRLVIDFALLALVFYPLV